MNLLAETCYTHDGWPFPFLFPLFFLLLFPIWFRPWRRRHWQAMGGERVLAERYARGEIDEDEYRARRQVLRDR